MFHRRLARSVLPVVATAGLLLTVGTSSVLADGHGSHKGSHPPGLGPHPGVGLHHGGYYHGFGFHPGFGGSPYYNRYHHNYLIGFGFYPWYYSLPMYPGYFNPAANAAYSYPYVYKYYGVYPPMTGGFNPDPSNSVVPPYIPPDGGAAPYGNPPPNGGVPPNNNVPPSTGAPLYNNVPPNGGVPPYGNQPPNAGAPLYNNVPPNGGLLPPYNNLPPNTGAPPNNSLPPNAGSPPAGTVAVPGKVPATPADKALLQVRVPSDAEVWFGDTKMKQTGTERMYASPSLDPKQTYAYEIRARWTTADGKPVTEVRQIQVQAGQFQFIDFQKPFPTTARAVP